MAPFDVRPPGFSAATLELLDQGLSQIWLEMQTAADAKAKTTLRPDAAAAAPSADVRDQGTRRAHPLKPAAATIAK